MKRKSLYSCLLLSTLGVCSISTLLKQNASHVYKVTKESDATTVTTDSDVFNFNYDWKFYLGDNQDASKENFDDSSWVKKNLPHDWSIEQDFDSSIPAAMGKLPAGIGWYRKKFIVPLEYKGRDIHINFDGAYMNSEFYINGHFIAKYPYGYTPFSYNITNYLAYGNDAVNTIAVKINSPLGNGRNSSRWYAGAGLNRNVTLTLDKTVHFVKDGINITNSIAGYSEQDFKNVSATSEEVSKKVIDTKNVLTKVKAEVENKTETAVKAKIRVSLLDYNTDNVVEEALESKEVLIQAEQRVNISLDYQLKNEIKLWDTVNPNLYNFKVETLVNGEVTDTSIIRYGFRNLYYTKRGFYLNGKYTKLNGACLHHDQGSLGAVSYKASVERQIRIMKDMGVNAIRTSHNTPTDTFLQACDENGMLVMEEFFDTWTTLKNTDDYGNHFEQLVPTDQGLLDVQQGDLWSDYDIRHSVRRDQNSPSVIMWSVGNEIYDTNNGEWSVNTVKRLIDDVKQTDTTRPITMGFPMWHGAGTALDNSSSWSFKVASELDLVGLNYPGSKRYEDYGNKESYKDWIVFGSENASAWKSRGVFDIKNGTVPFLDRQISSFDITNHFASQTDEWKWDRNSEFSLGQFIWTGFDYIGEPQPFDSGSNSAKSSYYGSVDTAGFPKAEYYMLKSQWMSPKVEPFVKIVNHSNVDDINLRNAISLDGGNTIQLWVSSNLKSVGLYLVNDDGSEELLDRRDWNQQSVLSAGGTNTHLNLQEPEGNPQGYTNKLYQIFTVNYQKVKGKKIVAKAYNNSVDDNIKDESPIATDELNYSQGSQKISLTPERRTIAADGQDLSYITVDITDENGVINPNANNEVYFSIKGQGEIVGVDNGDATSTERYKAGSDGIWKRSAFMGKALVIVRTTQEEGSFTLTARSNNLATGSVTVMTSKDNKEEQNVTYVSESLSYIAKIGISKEELESLLSKTLNVYSSDGSVLQKEVNWDTSRISDGDLTHDNEIHITGYFADLKNVQAKAIITIYGQTNTAIENQSTLVSLNENPVLPTKVYRVGSDGNREASTSVKWAAYDKEQLKQVGTFIIDGIAYFDSTRVKVTYTVRVVDTSDTHVQRENLALSSSVKASYQEGGHLATQVNDGILSKSNGWGNWENHNKLRSGDSLTFNFGYQASVDEIKVLFLDKSIDHAWFVPDEVVVEYLDANGEYQKVSNLNGAALGRDNFKSVGKDTQNLQDQLNSITFDKVTTSSIRVSFIINNLEDISHANNGDNTMLKVGEVEIYGEKKASDIFLSDEAFLGTIKVNGKELENFDPFQTNYTYSLKQGEKVPYVTALAALNGKVIIQRTENPYSRCTIKVVSENCLVEKIYTIQFVVVE